MRRDVENLGEFHAGASHVEDDEGREPRGGVPESEGGECSSAAEEVGSLEGESRARPAEEAREADELVVAEHDRAARLEVGARGVEEAAPLLAHLAERRAGGGDGGASSAPEDGRRARTRKRPPTLQRRASPARPSSRTWRRMRMTTSSGRTRPSDGADAWARAASARGGAGAGLGRDEDEDVTFPGEVS